MEECVSANGTPTAATARLVTVARTANKVRNVCYFLVSTYAMELSFETVKKFVSLCGQSGASLDNRACICLCTCLPTVSV